MALMPMFWGLDAMLDVGERDCAFRNSDSVGKEAVTQADIEGLSLRRCKHANGSSRERVNRLEGEWQS